MGSDILFWNFNKEYVLISEKDNIKTGKCQDKIRNLRMGDRRKLHKCTGLLTLIILFSTFLVLTSVKVKAKQTDPRGRVIVIDPGHGGHDKGVTGTGGTLEKDVALALSLMIATDLDGEYRAKLTRTDDYQVAVFDRTALANQSNADLFISIHTCGSFRHSARGIIIYYFKKSHENGSEGDSLSVVPIQSGNIQPPWNSLQDSYKGAGKILAESIKESILYETESFDIKIQDAPLMVLGGADMPAVLIETGCLTNPGDEKKLNNKKKLQAVSRGISRGIKEYLKLKMPE